MTGRTNEQGDQSSEKYPPAESWQTAWALVDSHGQQPTHRPGANDVSQGRTTVIDLTTGSAAVPVTHAQAMADPELGSGSIPTPASVSAASGSLVGTQQAATSVPSQSSNSSLTGVTTATPLHALTAPPLPTPWPLRVLRSSQLDAQRLDVELHSLLKEQLVKALSLLHPAHIAEWEPELNAALRLLIFSLSVFRGQATPGSQLLNLRYRSEAISPLLQPPPGPHVSTTTGSTSATAAAAGRAVLEGLRTGVEGAGLGLAQKVLLGLGMVVVPYVWSRVGTALARSVQPATLSWAELLAEEQAAADTAEDPAAKQPAAAGPGQGAPGHQPPTSDTAATADTSTETAKAGGGVLGLALLPLRRLLSRLFRVMRTLVHSVGKGWRQAWRVPTAEACLRGMRAVEGGYRALAFANLLIFLSGGRYRSLLERLVGARLVYLQPVMTRIISFEYLNRQLVWQEVSELLLFVLPLLDSLRLRRGALFRLLPRLPDPRSLLGGASSSQPAAAAPQPPQQHPAWVEGSGTAGSATPEVVQGTGAGGDSMHGGSDTGSAGMAGRLSGDTTGTPQWVATTPTAAAAAAAAAAGDAASQALLRAKAAATARHGVGVGPSSRPHSACPVCGERDMLTPVVAVPCGHCFCYYCLAANTAADRRFECPCDGVRVAAMERWKPGFRLATPMPTPTHA